MIRKCLFSMFCLLYAVILASSNPPVFQAEKQDEIDVRIKNLLQAFSQAKQQIQNTTPKVVLVSWPTGEGPGTTICPLWPIPEISAVTDSTRPVTGNHTNND